MKDLIMEILGYENIENIRIPEGYKKPRAEKLKRKREFYKRHRILPEIILDPSHMLLDGFCSYYIAAVDNIQYVKVRRSKEYRD